MTLRRETGFDTLVGPEPQPGETITVIPRKARPIGWVKVYSEVMSGHRWWRVECQIPHEPNTVSRWWKARWGGPRGALTSALEHLAGHAVRRAPMTPFEEVVREET